MDEHYNIEDAAALLGDITDKRMKKYRTKAAKDDLPDRYLAEATLNKYVVTEDYPKPGKKRQRHWRLTTKLQSIDPTESNEAQLRVIGVLCAKELPPIEINLHKEQNKKVRQHIRQQVKLTGFNNETFEKAIDQIEAIYVKMCARFSKDVIQPLELCSYESFSAIEAHSRYFTSLRDASSSEAVSFYPMVDPLGNLQEAMGHEFVHTKDNKVQYVVRERKGNGTYSYDEVDPVVFKVGDVVEANLSFTLVPVSPTQRRMVIELRSLALISDEVREAAELRRIRSRRIAARYAQDMGVRALKRKAAYTAEDNSDEDSNEDVGEPAMQRLRISNDSNEMNE